MGRYLVTGGCGFIGSHLVDDLLAEGHEVRVLDNLSTGSLHNIPSTVDIAIGEVADTAILSDLVADLDGCFHLAAIASVARSNEDWIGTHRTNLGGTIAILDAARRPGGAGPLPVVLASSAAVYGRLPPPAGEDSLTQPLTAYGADKLGSELHASVAWGIHGVPTTALRFFNVYGPRQDPRSPYSGVISIFYDRLSRGLPVVIHGDGGQSRDFIYVADVVSHLRAAMAVLKSGSHVYNVCTGRPTTIRELAELIGSILRTEPEIQSAEPRPGDIRESLGLPERAIAELGLRARFGVEEGLRELIAYSAAGRHSA